MTTHSPINIVQITDTHLYGRSSGTLLKMNTADSLSKVIQKMTENEKNVDLILATGDIAQDASQVAYENFIDIIEALKIPFRWIPGNHDDVAIMQQVGAGKDVNEKLLTINNWLIIMLDSSIKGQVHGRLAESELEFLQWSLQTAEESEKIEHCLICLHHNPVPGTAGWMRDIGLENGPLFFQTIASFPKVKSVVYAHIHQALDYILNDVRCFCTPSTCIQFKPNVTNFTLDRLNPGYRRFKLFADGTIDSTVIRIEGDGIEADFSSGGY
jgi:Icc protein